MDDFYVHPTAVIDDDVQIGKATRIWHFSHVMSNVRIGDECVLGQNVFVGTGVAVGHHVKIQNNVSVYTGVQIESEVFVGPSAVFTNVINPRSGIERKDQFQKTTVKRGSTIGANATILCGVDIGEHAFIGAGAVITRDVPPFALVVGNPGNQIGWMSIKGHRLAFDQNGIANCPEDGSKYVLAEGQVKLEQ